MYAGRGWGGGVDFIHCFSDALVAQYLAHRPERPMPPFSGTRHFYIKLLRCGRWQRRIGSVYHRRGRNMMNGLKRQFVILVLHNGSNLLISVHPGRMSCPYLLYTSSKPTPTHRDDRHMVYRIINEA